MLGAFSYKRIRAKLPSKKPSRSGFPDSRRAPVVQVVTLLRS
jgi:hypothetical protein